MASLGATSAPPLRLLFASSDSTSSDTWRRIAQDHPHWRVDLTSSASSARRYLDDHAVDAVIAGITAVDGSMAAVLAIARATRPAVRRIALVDGATRTHPEARCATVVLEVQELASLVSQLDTALSASGPRPRRTAAIRTRTQGRTDPGG